MVQGPFRGPLCCVDGAVMYRTDKGEIMTYSGPRAYSNTAPKVGLDFVARVGDLVICDGEYVPVLEIVTHKAAAHRLSPIRNDWAAREWRTERGSRWAGIQPTDETPCGLNDDCDL